MYTNENTLESKSIVELRRKVPHADTLLQRRVDTVPAKVYVGAKKFAQGFTYMGVFPTHGGVHIC